MESTFRAWFRLLESGRKHLIDLPRHCLLAACLCRRASSFMPPQAVKNFMCPAPHAPGRLPQGNSLWAFRRDRQFGLDGDADGGEFAQNDAEANNRQQPNEPHKSRTSGRPHPR